MSRYEETSESNGYKCPYCGELHEVDDWGHDYDEETMECSVCQKKFYATASHSVDYESMPDCEVNGEEHKLEHFRDNSYFCEICNRCVILYPKTPKEK